MSLISIAAIGTMYASFLLVKYAPLNSAREIIGEKLGGTGKNLDATASAISAIGNIKFILKPN